MEICRSSLFHILENVIRRLANVFDFVYIRKMLNLSYCRQNHQHFNCVVEIMQKSSMEPKPVHLLNKFVSQIITKTLI